MAVSRLSPEIFWLYYISTIAVIAILSSEYLGVQVGAKTLSVWQVLILQ
jgi:hypothetical protein